MYFYIEQQTVLNSEKQVSFVCLPATLWGLDLDTPGPGQGESGFLKTNRWCRWFCLQRGSSVGPCSHSSGCRCNLHTPTGQRLRHAWRRDDQQLKSHSHSSSTSQPRRRAALPTWRWCFQWGWLQRWGTVCLSWWILGPENQNQQRSSPGEFLQLLQGPVWLFSALAVF